jgi:hypothetical protein
MSNAVFETCSNLLIVHKGFGMLILAIRAHNQDKLLSIQEKGSTIIGTSQESVTKKVCAS